MVKLEQFYKVVHDPILRAVQSTSSGLNDTPIGLKQAVEVVIHEPVVQPFGIAFDTLEFESSLDQYRIGTQVPGRRRRSDPVQTQTIKAMPEHRVHRPTHQPATLKFRAEPVTQRRLPV